MKRTQNQRDPGAWYTSHVHASTTPVKQALHHQKFAFVVVILLVFMSISTIPLLGISREFEGTQNGGPHFKEIEWDRESCREESTGKDCDLITVKNDYESTGNPEESKDAASIETEGLRNGEDSENGLTVENWEMEDQDGDDLFDFLVVDLTLMEPAAENMKIISILESKDPGSGSQNVMGIIDVSQDQQAVSLRLSGTDIYIREINGPFYLSLDLMEGDGRVNSTYLTIDQELSYRAFESPYSCGFHSEIGHEGMDMDDDQLFEFLDITTSVFTRTAGTYTIMAELVGQQTYLDRKNVQGNPSSRGEPGYFGDSAIASSFDSLSINETQEISSNATLRFDGTLINLSNEDGPYYIVAYIFLEGGFVDTRDWVLPGYDHLLFQGPSVHATLTETYFIISQNEGYQFNTGIHVEEMDTFQLTGEIFSYYGMDTNDQKYDQLTDTNTTQLQSGYHNVTLAFESDLIIQNTHILLTLTSMSTGGTDIVELEYHIPPHGGYSNDYTPGSSDYEDIGDSIQRDPVIVTLAIDNTGDEKYEFLKIDVNAGLPDGDYTAYAVVYADSGDDQGRVISSASDDFIVSNDDQEYSILIPGNDIYLSGMNGPYNVQVFITSEGGEISTYEGTTMVYRSDDFSPQRSYETDPEPAFFVTNNSVFAHTDVLAAEVLKNSPELSYYYYRDMGESVKFRLRHTRLIAFNDDGDDFYSGSDSGDDILYQSFLSTGNWELNPIAYGNDERMGSHISFNMTTSLSMEPVQDGLVGVRDWGTMSLQFLISNNTVDDPDLKIRGGEEIKITVEISQERSLPVTSIALEQMIIPMNTELQVKAGEEISWLVQNDPSDTITDLDASRLDFTSGDGTILGYYSWDNDAVFRSEDGSETQGTVSPSMKISDGYVLLYFSYPLTQDVQHIVHDPWAGVVRENAPTIAQKDDEDLASPAGYLLGLILATTVVTITMFGKGFAGKRSGSKGSERIPGKGEVTDPGKRPAEGDDQGGKEKL